MNCQHAQTCCVNVDVVAMAMRVGYRPQHAEGGLALTCHTGVLDLDVFKRRRAGVPEQTV